MSRLYVVFAGGLVLTCGAPALGQEVDTTTLSVRREHPGALQGSPPSGDLFALHRVEEIGFVPVVESSGPPTSLRSAVESRASRLIVPFVQYGAPQRLTGGLSVLLPIKERGVGDGVTRAIGIELQGSAGQGGWRVAAGPFSSSLPWNWVDVLVTATRTTNHPRGALSESTYVGVEAGFAVLTPLAALPLPFGVMVKPSFGFGHRLDGPADLKRTMFTWSVGGHVLAEFLTF